MKKRITSIHNPYVKYLIHLREKSSYRKRYQRFVLEGKRELMLAIQAGYQVEQLLYCPDIVVLNQLSREEYLLFSTLKTTEISLEVYQKLAYRGSTEGFIAEVRCKSHTLESIDFKTDTPLVLVMEAPEKPGNIGALLRTADAASLDAVFIANPKTDLYNSNVIRSSVGCVFTNNIGVGSTREILEFLQSRNFSIYCTALTASVPYYEVSFLGSSAIVVGTEDVGLSHKWLSNSFQNIIIPMRGKIDSMNVSVAAGIVVFEAVRQRMI